MFGMVSVVSAGFIVNRTFDHEISFTTDTLADTSSGDGLTNTTDTISLFQPFAWNTVMVRAIIYDPPLSKRGIGLTDSVCWVLEREFWGVCDTIAADTSAAIPDTFTYMISGANDTVVRGNWRLLIETIDTTTDTAASSYYPVHVEYQAVPIED